MKPKGLPIKTNVAVSKLIDIWQNALRFADQAERRQAIVYSDKSVQAIANARQNGIEHGMSFFREQVAESLQAIDEFRTLALSRGLNPEEYLREAGVPDQWLRQEVSQ